MSETACEPLLKWAGGKRRLLPAILPLVPETFGRYYEPFVGGGAVFFSLAPRSATLSDSNAELINTYVQVRDNLTPLISELRKLRNSEADYYRIRATVPRSATAKAARLIYLCTLSFNGVYRQNLDGYFNVPYGHKRHLDPCDVIKLRQASESLRRCDLLATDFEEAVGEARRGDLVFFDPPYTVAHRNNGFVKYNAKIFSWHDQVRLASLAMKLRRTGIRVIVSNADHPTIRGLYRGFRVRTVTRCSVMAASARFRRPITECLFY